MYVKLDLLFLYIDFGQNRGGLEIALFVIILIFLIIILPTYRILPLNWCTLYKVQWYDHKRMIKRVSETFIHFESTI